MIQPLVTVYAYNNISLLSHLENSYLSFKTLLKHVYHL